MTAVEHDQTKWPLATLVILADQRKIEQKAKLLKLAQQIAKDRGHTL
jgi:hypothetical protein